MGRPLFEGNLQLLSSIPCLFLLIVDTLGHHHSPPSPSTLISPSNPLKFIFSKILPQFDLLKMFSAGHFGPLFLVIFLSFLFNGIIAPGAHKFKARNGRDLWALAQEEARLADILINGSEEDIELVGNCLANCQRQQPKCGGGGQSSECFSECVEKCLPN